MTSDTDGSYAPLHWHVCCIIDVGTDEQLGVELLSRIETRRPKMSDSKEQTNEIDQENSTKGAHEMFAIERETIYNLSTELLEVAGAATGPTLDAYLLLVNESGAKTGMT